MSEREPIPLSVSVESGYNSPSLRNRGVRIYYVRPEWHGLGVCEVKTPDGNAVGAYDKERTVCDLIRKRASADVTEFNQAMRAWAKSRDRNLARLSEVRQEDEHGIQSMGRDWSSPMIDNPRRVKDLIKNLAKGDSGRAQLLQRRYAMERFLERITESIYRENLVLKGGMLVTSMLGRRGAHDPGHRRDHARQAP